MNRILCLLLAIGLLLSLCACSQEKDTEIPEDITFKSQTLLDTEQCRFAVTQIQETSLDGCIMTIEVENRTDMALTIAVEQASVNGCMCNPYFSNYVEAGQTVTEQVVFSREHLDGYGITAVTQIEFIFTAYDEDTYEAIYIEEPCTLYPRGKDAAHYEKRKSKDTDIVLMDNEKCTVIVTGHDAQSFWGYDVYVYIQNKTDEALMFTTQEAALNDVVCDPFWTTTVSPGKCSNSTMYWFDNDLADAGITDVESITMILSVSELSNWFDPIITETITFTP